MHDSSDPVSSRNHLLRSFSPESLARLLPHLKAIDTVHGTKLYTAYQPITHVYFPENSMASIVANTPTGQSTEIGVVGREGAVGLEVLMGVDSVPHDSMIQIPNGAWQIPSEALKAEFDTCETSRIVLLKFMYKLQSQIGQTTLCNRLHSVEQRLARWLLLCDDRIDAPTLQLTQDFLAIMLGVSRVSVTLAAQALQDVSYIKYRRGEITVLDREGLEDAVCDCYKIVRREYDRD